MSTLDLILISISIPMGILTIVMYMVYHEYKKTLRKPPKNR